MKTMLTLLAAFFVVQASFAGECQLTTERKACTGREIEALRPYEGKNPTTEKVPAENADTCLKKAEKAAKIIRKGTLTQKTVTVKFDGKDLKKTFTEKADCR
jgi:hypothetical protein